MTCDLKALKDEIYIGVLQTTCRDFCVGVFLLQLAYSLYSQVSKEKEIEFIFCVIIIIALDQRTFLVNFFVCLGPEGQNFQGEYKISHMILETL